MVEIVSTFSVLFSSFRVFSGNGLISMWFGFNGIEE